MPFLLPLQYGKDTSTFKNSDFCAEQNRTEDYLSIAVQLVMTVIGCGATLWSFSLGLPRGQVQIEVGRPARDTKSLMNNSAKRPDPMTILWSSADVISGWSDVMRANLP